MSKRGIKEKRADIGIKKRAIKSPKLSLSIEERQNMSRILEAKGPKLAIPKSPIDLINRPKLKSNFKGGKISNKRRNKY